MRDGKRGDAQREKGRAKGPDMHGWKTERVTFLNGAPGQKGGRIKRMGGLFVRLFR